MKTSEIRMRFLNYFKKNGHTIVESSALIPHNDPTLLFTTAGMVQFKDVFLGRDPRPYTRATSSQKCVRAGGKHNDLENVGFTARHHTFFEMLGNFSFGDYFKKEAIHFAWQFVTEELKLSKDRLYVSVFEKDDESAEIWHKQEGVSLDRISKFGEKDNFWSMGDTGPCGPCTELFVDRGEKYGCKKSTCKMGCDCDRYMEFWNLVFMQYDRSADGKLNPLPKPSVDTGAGLERIALILQDVETNYDTDGFQHIISETAKLARKPYQLGTADAASFRVIADHSRATAFLISDGVMPSNEGRGYVLRRIMRRAIRHGKKLGFTGPFLYKTCGYVVDQMKEAYPDLLDKRVLIEKAVMAEEEQFFKTLERGLSLLDEETSKLKKGGTLPGTIAFKLYDTYGFPIDLTRVICSETGLAVDEAGFEKEMNHQRSESRKHWKGSGDEALSSVYLETAQGLAKKSKTPLFVGYEKLSANGECVALFNRDDSSLTSVNEGHVGQTIEAVFNPTPFYGESGGQTGDRGRILAGSNFEAEVLDVQKPTSDLIVTHLKILKGSLKVGGHYDQEIQPEIRALTARNHTATHMLQWALQEVLGKHVKQAGSLVSPDLLRFDFSHFQAMTAQEIEKVEFLINEKIWHNFNVSKKEMPKDEAIKAGAIAFFGEKYGDKVRVVSIGGFSTELCGGTHVDHSSDIHLLKIISETGIAAGVRRMIALTSKKAYQYLKDRDAVLQEVQERLKANSTDDVLVKMDKVSQNEKELKRQLESFAGQAAGREVETLLASARAITGAQLVSAVCEPSADGIKKLREIADRIKQKLPDSFLVLGIQDGEKAALLVTTGPQAKAKKTASDVLKEIAPLIDGKGGGKPDLAQAGGTKPSGLKEAIQKAIALLA